MLQAKDANNSEIDTPTTTMTHPPTDPPHPTMELAIDEFPTLPTKPPLTHLNNDIEDTEFSDDSMEQSPAITSKQPIQTAFKRLLETTSDSEDHSTTNLLTRDQNNVIIHI